MLDGLEVAVQVQYQVGVTGQALQDQALGLEGRAGGVCVQPAAQVFTDQGNVVGRVLSQVLFDLITDAV